jgi:hypothetical protein
MFFRPFERPLSLWQKIGLAAASVPLIGGALFGGAKAFAPHSSPAAVSIKDEFSLQGELAKVKAMTRQEAATIPNLSVDQAKWPGAHLPSTIVGTSITDEILYNPAINPQKFMSYVQSENLNTVRIGASWEYIQPNGPQDARFQRLDQWLKAANDHHVRVILTVGAKAPGWPEYHFPSWVLPNTNAHDLSTNPAFVKEDEAFVRLVMEHEKNNPALAAVQPGNEENDPSGRFGQIIGTPLLKAEIRIIREIDGNKVPVEVNVWCSPRDLAQLREAFALGDLVGLDSYIATPSTAGAWGRTVQVPNYAIQLSKETGKVVFISEVQAEPWGTSQPNYDPVKDLAGLVRLFLRQGYTNFEFWRISYNYSRDLVGDHRVDNVEARIAAQLLGKYVPKPTPTTLPHSSNLYTVVPIPNPHQAKQGS